MSHSGKLCCPTVVTRILIVGGGYAGFYAAWKLEKRLRANEAELVVVDPRPYLTYQPFLPEVVAGSVEAGTPRCPCAGTCAAPG